MKVAQRKGARTDVTQTLVPTLVRGLNPKQAAVALSVSRRQIDHLVISGELGSFKIGSRRVIPFSAIDSFIEKRVAAERAERAEVA
jgi:excisionase family DNA binding protein